MSVFVNDRDLSALVWHILAADGHLSPAVPVSPTLPLANGPGVIGSTATVSARKVVVTLDVRSDTLVGRDAAIDTLARQLSGRVELRFASTPTRAMAVTCTAVDVQLLTGAHANGSCLVVVTFEAADPARFDLQPVTYGLTTGRAACPVGTVTSGPDIEIYGSCVNPVVILRSHTGAEVARLTFACTLAATDTLVIDCGAQTVDRWNSGVKQTGAAAGLALLASGSFPILSPEDASPLAISWPTLELSATSGTPTGLVSYSRRW